jgi:hypothetical protein
MSKTSIFDIEQVFLSVYRTSEGIVDNSFIEASFIYEGDMYNCVVNIDNPNDEEKNMDLGEFVRLRISKGKFE